MRRGWLSAISISTGFKDVNDGYGHATGDLLLAALAHRLRSGLRASDMPGRLGGDEFALILEDLPTEWEVATQVVYRLLACLKTAYVLDGQEIVCPASIGIATARPGDTAEQLLARADAALYEAKRAGKGQVFSAGREGGGGRA